MSFASSPPAHVSMGPPEPVKAYEHRSYNSSSDPLFVPEEMSTDIFHGSTIPSSEIRTLQDTNSELHSRLSEIVKNKLQNLTHTNFDEEAHRQQALKPAIQLSSEQQQVHAMIVNQKRSLFFTGAAGTGKSILLRRVINDLRQIYGHHAVGVTAPTGIAAVAIGGRTIHAWGGIGLGNGDAKKLLASVKRQPAKKQNWVNCKALIIDEISMLSPDLLDKLNYIAQKIKKKEGVPFGGIQLICTGDFFQLPPVDREKMAGDRRLFAFDAECWKSCITATILLTQVFRQKDQHFQDMLNELRYGQLSDSTIETFKKLSRAPKMPADVVPTRLFSLRREVDTANNAALAKLEGEPRVYDAVDAAYETTVNGVKQTVDLTKIQWMAPDRVRLKEGAQVMMIKNIDSMLVNGSIGKVIKFIPKPKLSNPDGVNRSSACIPLGDMVTSVQGYTCRELLKLDRCLDKIADSDTEIVPLVRFYNRDGTVREMVVCPEEWVMENEHGETMATRKQIPLILAYALSIHKSQGQTLDYVSVNMNKVFEAGQAYVALSRATSLEGLQVAGFNPNKVLTDGRVKKFYESLTQITHSYQPTVKDLFKRQEPEPVSMSKLFEEYLYKKPKTEQDLDLKSDPPIELDGVKSEPMYPAFDEPPSKAPEIKNEVLYPAPEELEVLAVHEAHPQVPLRAPQNFSITLSSSDIELPPPPEPDYDSDFDSPVVNFTYRSRKCYNDMI